MVDGVKGSGHVKQAKRGNVPVVGSEQKVVIDLQDGGLGTVKPAMLNYKTVKLK